MPVVVECLIGYKRAKFDSARKLYQSPQAQLAAGRRTLRDPTFTPELARLRCDVYFPFVERGGSISRPDEFCGCYVAIALPSGWPSAKCRKKEEQEG